MLGNLEVKVLYTTWWRWGLPIKGPKCQWRSVNPNRLTSRTAFVRTRMPGGVTGKAREGIPMFIRPVGKQ